MSEPKIKVTTRSLKDYQPHPNNPNRHTERGLQIVEDSVNYNGAGRSGLAAADGTLLAGNGTWEAMERAGIREVIEVETDGHQWVIVKRNDLTPDDARAKALMLSDNRASELGYDPDAELLGALLADIAAQDEHLLRGAGFTEGELAALLDGMQDTPAVDAGAQVDRAAELQQVWQVQPGDLWVIPSAHGGEHRLLCGDSTKAEDVARLMGGEKALLMVTDPPYGIEHDTTWREKAGISSAGPQSAHDIQWDGNADWRAAYQLANTDIAYVWHATTFTRVVADGLESAGYEVKQQIIWNKTVAAFGRSHYSYKHEPCWYAVRKGKTSQWCGASNEVTVWDLASPLHIMGGSDEEKQPHATQKPLECMARPIRNHDAPIVYDPFLGSGTTAVAAESLRRRCLGIEIAEKYCAVILQRLADMGLEPARVE